MSPYQTTAVLYLTSFLVLGFEIGCSETQSSNTHMCTVTLGKCLYAVRFYESPMCAQQRDGGEAANLPTDNGKSGNKNKSFRNRNPRRTKSSMQQQYQRDPDLMKQFQAMDKNMNALSVRLLRGMRRLEQNIKQIMAPKGWRTTTTQATKCKQGFISVDNWPSCYLLSNFQTTWFEAKDFCSAQDADLIAMGTVKEHYITSFLIQNTKPYSAAKGWWTSGIFVDKTRQWMWTSSIYAQPFMFVKWARNQPNATSSQCMLFSKADDYLWHDDLCTQKHNFICEMNAIPLTNIP